MAWTEEKGREEGAERGAEAPPPKGRGHANVGGNPGGRRGPRCGDTVFSWVRRPGGAGSVQVACSQSQGTQVGERNAETLYTELSSEANGSQQISSVFPSHPDDMRSAQVRLAVAMDE